jgi:hypothetical protein
LLFACRPLLSAFCILRAAYCLQRVPHTSRPLRCRRPFGRTDGVPGFVARAFAARGFYHQERTAGRKGLRYMPRPGGPKDFSPRRKPWDSIGVKIFPSPGRGERPAAWLQRSKLP